MRFAIPRSSILSALIRRANPSCARCASRGGYAARAQGAFCAWLDFERGCGLGAACGHKARALAAGFNRPYEGIKRWTRTI